MRHNQLLLEKIKESLASVLPITAIVLIISITVAPLTPGTMVLFLFGAVLLVVGMGLFTLGVDMSMIPMGDGMRRADQQSPPGGDPAGGLLCAGLRGHHGRTRFAGAGRTVALGSQHDPDLGGGPLGVGFFLVVAPGAYAAEHPAVLHAGVLLPCGLCTLVFCAGEFCPGGF